MTTLRALVIAFSMYSQIPMPQFTWQDKEMKYKKVLLSLPNDPLPSGCRVNEILLQEKHPTPERFSF